MSNIFVGNRYHGLVFEFLLKSLTDSEYSFGAISVLFQNIYKRSTISFLENKIRTFKCYL